jgi:hypothetical protein
MKLVKQVREEMGDDLTNHPEKIAGRLEDVALTGIWVYR